MGHVAERETGILHFSQSESSLEHCIESNFHVSKSERFTFWNQLGNYPYNQIRKNIARFVSKKISGKTIGRNLIAKKAEDLMVDARCHLYHDRTQGDSGFWSTLEKALLRALLDCSLYSRYLEPTDPLKYEGIKLFPDESPELAAVLDYASVNWAVPLEEMITTRIGRSLLRSYAQDAREAIYCALNTEGMTVNLFRIKLRALWMVRAQFYFDVRDHEQPYPIYRYTIDYHLPHTRISDEISSRQFIGPEKRNSLVNESQFDEIFNIHRQDRSSDDRCDIFDFYHENGMASADYYFERQMDQLYRIVLFYQELEAVGITSDDDDHLDGELSVIPERLRRIIYDDYAYRQYLLRRRRSEMLSNDNDGQHDIRQSLGNKARVWEEYFILLGSPANRQHTVTNTTSTTSTTTISPTTTDRSTSKKGSFCVNKYGKHFKGRTFSDNSESDEDYQTGNNGLNWFKQSCLEKEYNYYETSSIDKFFISSPNIKQYLQQEIKTPENYFGFVAYDENPNNLVDQEKYIIQFI